MAGPTSEDEEIDRLRRRLARQRKARMEAEAIAEESVARLYAINQDLDRRIAERTRELDEARITAERANQAKSQFLAHVSHEVRTPLNGISGMIELLASAEKDPQRHEWLASATVSVDRLDRLFDRLLRYVELEGFQATGQVDRRPVEAVLDAAAQRWRVRAAGAKQLLSVESSVASDVVVRSTAELDMAIDELLENAINHAVPGPLHLVAESAAVGLVRIGVSDTGPGFRYEDIAQRGGFDPGDTVTTRGDRGPGLGLALVERVTAGFGGRLFVDAEPGRGSHVWLELPAHSNAGGAIR